MIFVLFTVILKLFVATKNAVNSTAEFARRTISTINIYLWKRIVRLGFCRIGQLYKKARSGWCEEIGKKCNNGASIKSHLQYRHGSQISNICVWTKIRQLCVSFKKSQTQQRLFVQKALHKWCFYIGGGVTLIRVKEHIFARLKSIY